MAEIESTVQIYILEAGIDFEEDLGWSSVFNQSGSLSTNHKLAHKTHH